MSHTDELSSELRAWRTLWQIYILSRAIGYASYIVALLVSYRPAQVYIALLKFIAISKNTEQTLFLRV